MFVSNFNFLPYLYTFGHSIFHFLQKHETQMPHLYCFDYQMPTLTQQKSKKTNNGNGDSPKLTFIEIVCGSVKFCVPVNNSIDIFTRYFRFRSSIRSTEKPKSAPLCNLLNRIEIRLVPVDYQIKMVKITVPYLNECNTIGAADRMLVRIY